MGSSRTSIGRAAASTPSTVTRPAAGFSGVVSIRMVVVLPAPLGPSSPNVSPGRISRSTSFTATCSPNR